MNSLIETLNRFGDGFTRFAWPMLWQSSLLIALIFALDFALKRKVRAAVRYALWLVVLVKLVIPPSVALPTGLAWWLRPSRPPPAVTQPKEFNVTFSPPLALSARAQPLAPVIAVIPSAPRLSLSAVILLAGATVSLLFFTMLLLRWRRVALQIRRTEAPSEALAQMFARVRREAGVLWRVRLRLTKEPISPAVCGLFRPCVLLAAPLAEKLPIEQVRAVLLHELIHLRRADVCVNCAQTLLQIVYWWHPLLWFANARIRRLREEAVDDAVMIALRDDADVYAPTLLEISKLAFDTPLTSLGLVGILESKRALSQRIERLLDFQPPRRAGLSFVSVLGVLAFTCMAVPQGKAPAKPSTVLTVSALLTGNSEAEKPFGADSELSRILKAAENTDESGVGNITNTISINEATPGILHRLDPLGWDSDLDSTYSRALKQKARELESGEFLARYDNTTVELGLATRGFRVNPITFLPSLERAVGVPGELIATNYTQLVGEYRTSYVPIREQDPLLPPFTNWTTAAAALWSYMQSRGVELRPPKTITWSKTKEMFLVRAASEDMDKVEAVITALNVRQSASQESPTPRPRTLEEARAEGRQQPRLVAENARPEIPDASEKSAALTREAGELFLAHKLDDAAAKIKEALNLNPNNQQAYYYSNIIEHARDPQAPKSPRILVNDPNRARAATNDARRMLLDRLIYTRLDRASFDDVPLSEVIRFLTEQTRKLETHVNFIMSPYAPQGEAIDIGAVRIKIAQPLTNVSLFEILNAVVTHADKPIKYTVEDYGLVFSQKIGKAQELSVRTFRVDPNTFLEGLERAVGGTQSMSSPTNVTAALRAFFRSRGVDLDPPKNIYWKDRQGTLLVRATMRELDTVEAVIQILNILPQQIAIRAAFVAIPQKASVGFWKSLGATNMTGRPEGAILAATQAVTILEALKLQKGVDLLPEFKVTTLSGRRAQLQNVKSQTVVTQVTNGVKEPAYLTETVSCGPILDVQPNLVPGTYEIELQTVVTLNEFLGYDDPGKQLVEVLVDGKPTRVKPPLPRFRMRQLPTNAVVLDGQTLVLGKAEASEIVNKKAVKPVPKSDAARKDLVVFITPTLIDPAGNPLRPSDSTASPTPKHP